LLLNKSDEKKTVLVDFSLLASIRTGGRFGGFGAGAPPAPPAGTPGAAAGNRAPGATATTGPRPAAGPQGNMQRMTPLTLENYRVRDLWDHKDLTLKETSMYVEILPHAAKVYRFIRK
jgi:hypothetical protein